MLLDDHSAGRVRHEDHHGRGLPSVDTVAHLPGHVDHVRPPLGFQCELAHGRIPPSGRGTPGVGYERHSRGPPVFSRPVSEVPSPSRELDAYCDQADRFVATLNEEYYLHLSGQKALLELAPIYDAHASLTTLEACSDLRQSGSPELWRFACEGYLGNLTRRQEEQRAELETRLEAELDGDRIGYRMLRPAIANEPDRDRRERLERARIGLVDELNPVLAEAHEQTAEAARELGGELSGTLRGFGFGLTEARRTMRAVSGGHGGSLRRGLRSAAAHAPRARHRRRPALGRPETARGSTWDEGFPASGMLPALESTLTDLGIDLPAQRNIQLDIERRPLKTPRAYCFPIEVPGRVVLMIQPIGGLDDWNALFHEAGHTEHFAHTSPRLSFEARRLGDNAVTECWAFLLEHLVSDPVWLNRRLDFGRPDEFASEGAAVTLYFVRRYSGNFSTSSSFTPTAGRR